MGRKTPKKGEKGFGEGTRRCHPSCWKIEEGSDQVCGRMKSGTPFTPT